MQNSIQVMQSIQLFWYLSWPQILFVKRCIDLARHTCASTEGATPTDPDTYKYCSKSPTTRFHELTNNLYIDFSEIVLQSGDIPLTLGDIPEVRLAWTICLGVPQIYGTLSWPSNCRIFSLVEVCTHDCARIYPARFVRFALPQGTGQLMRV